MFESNGRLTQVELANLAASRGNPIISFSVGSQVVLIALNDLPDADDKSPTTAALIPLDHKIHKISKYTAFAASGISSDCQYLSSWLAKKSDDHDYLFSTAPSPLRLAKMLSSHIHRSSLTALSRPFGCGVSLVGWDEETKKCVQVDLDSQGNLRSPSICVIGILFVA